MKEKSPVKEDWISVEDKPKKSGYYLVYDVNTFGETKIELYFYNATTDSWLWGADCFHPQYWQPLPAPPIETNIIKVNL